MEESPGCRRYEQIAVVVPLISSIEVIERAVLHRLLAISTPFRCSVRLIRISHPTTLAMQHRTPPVQTQQCMRTVKCNLPQPSSVSSLIIPRPQSAIQRVSYNRHIVRTLLYSQAPQHRPRPRSSTHLRVHAQMSSPTSRASCSSRPATRY